MDRNWVVLGVSLLVWGLLFVWVLRVERRVNEVEEQLGRRDGEPSTKAKAS